MKRLFFLIPVLAGMLLFFTGCPYGYNHNEGRFPYDPVNLEWANSEYDDYNMSSPVIENWRYLYFSSNRTSQGNNFDIVGSQFHLLWDKDKGTLEVDDDPDGFREMAYVDSLFERMNTPANEYGPYSTFWTGYDGTHESYTDLIVYSNDESGNQDIRLVYYESQGDFYPIPEGAIFAGPEPVKLFNSEANDAYVSFYGQNYWQNDWGNDPSYITEILFCSDRDGDFDLYQADMPEGSSIIDFLLSDSTAAISPVDLLNSSAQDKCPYVDGQLLVFASDRPGGYGGFDLYYSQRNGDVWSAPVNFGSRINTEYNEYRPIVMMFYEYQNDLMLFSSDRAGGKGGYDLYYVGIAGMIQ